MTWSPEMDLIDQLCGGDMPLHCVATLFGSADHARNVVAIYVRKGIVKLADQEGVLANWKAESILRDPMSY
jgi:hypothetical protein